MDELYLAVLLCFAAGVLSSFLGWAESIEPFAPRKLLSALIRAGIGGMVVAYGFLQSHAPPLAPIDWLLLFLSAMGADVLINTSYKVIATKGKE